MYPAVFAILLLVEITPQGPPTVESGFEDATVGAVPRGWKVDQTGVGRGSEWKVVEDKTAPKAAKVLAQTAESPGPMFNLCVVEASNFHDVEVTVAFKAVKGRTDQGGGVVWRYIDANNYYVARYNPLESNYRVYKVVEGKRTQLATKEGLKCPAGEWHALTIRTRGKEIACLLDGIQHLQATDDTLKQPGQVGLWTKADAHTHFDDFQAKELTRSRTPEK